MSILDDGPGIPEAQLGAMFDPFMRGDNSRSLDTGGAGLGAVDRARHHPRPMAARSRCRTAPKAGSRRG
ncbi:ATP-binding protein [Limimaricola hongkongensis]|uniref:ATP-binding protein n=1 Tax=Limimaricola hongkongensis TaxID=278132 RepID=UPI001FE0D58B|nr:ATP-binding protein [Limimaricola hongkongensis]